MSLTKTSFSMITGAVTNVRDYGAVGNGVADDTAAIQAAFDSPNLTPVFFPPGLYKITGSGAACLTLTRNKNIFGCARSSQIRADFAGANTALLRIAITENGGFGDCRGWTMKDIFAFHNGGGKNGLEFVGGMSMIDALVQNCSFGAGTNTAGYGIYVEDQLSHSEICNSQFDSAYMQCFDANVIRKCITFGEKCAITFDCEFGVRNNSVLDCTLVNRDGAVRIINGDNIRIENNQMELAQGYTPPNNQTVPSSMIWLEGVDRLISNTVIRANNFGGGLNMKHSIYFDNAYRTVVTENYFNATDEEDLYFTANSRFNMVYPDNTMGIEYQPRPNTRFKITAEDLGYSNMGVLQPGSKLNAQNDWVAPSFYKDVNGIVHFLGTWEAGIPGSTTLLGTMPAGFRPFLTLQNYQVTTSVSDDVVSINGVNGQIISVNLTQNSSVLISSFESAETED